MNALLLLCAVASAETDEIGSNDTYNNNGDMMKLVILEVTEAAVLTEVEFAVYNYRSDGDVVMVFYRQTSDGSFELVEQMDAQDLPASEGGWASTGDVSWLVQPGDVIAVGVWIASDWYYYYDDRQTDSPWFGEVLGGMRVEDRVPDRFEGELEAFYYWMRVTSEVADADGDGGVAESLGGTDCDDGDATVGEGMPENAYDGIDQDCDGADLSDVDGDGEDAVVVGGPDCADDDAGISSTAEEVCGDGVDQDCSGADLDCADDVDGDGEPDAGGDAGKLDLSPGGCGCGTGAEPVGLAALLALGAAVRRRR